MDDKVYLRHALIVRGDRVYISSTVDSAPAFSQFARLYQFDATREKQWYCHDVAMWTVGLEKFRDSPESAWSLCALSERGEMELFTQGKSVIEPVADAGLFRPQAAGYGYLSCLRAIEGRLYACGSAGQVLKRLGPAEWVHMDEGILQPLNVEDRLLLTCMDGISHDNIYVAGNLPGPSGYFGCVFHWNGSSWRRLELPEVKPLTAIYIESEQRVWIAGRDGTLLSGNHRDGLQLLPVDPRKPLFHDLTLFNGTLYLASNLGLFRYDEKRRAMVRMRTKMSPELSYVSTVDHADGVLWAIGPRDIAKYDGKTWMRVEHPDMPRD